MKKLTEIFEKNGQKIEKSQISQFEKYFSYLSSENEKFNLTAITEEEEVCLKHFLDSILPKNEFPKNSKVVDIGSGAGFPAIPLKILRPDLEICMVDSLQKRVNFLNETISLLNLEKSTAIHSRAEDFCKNNRESFDVAVARAVAPLNTLVEYLLPLVKLGGRAIIYKSVRLEEEISEAEKAIKILGGKIEKIENYTVFSMKNEEFLRRILIISKVSPTPKKYPRGENKPRLSPIK